MINNYIFLTNMHDSYIWYMHNLSEFEFSYTVMLQLFVNRLLCLREYISNKCLMIRRSTQKRG
jgi:hypothetical protein